MKKDKPKLIVSGCSLSDRGNANICYGDTLSELLDMEYVHQARGCGSNYRIWRTITSMIMSGEITSNDKVIIQYTTRNRREFWTSNYVEKHDRYYDSSIHNTDNSGVIELVEEYGDFGFTVKYKSGAYSWQSNKKTAKFFEQYQGEFVNAEYDYEMFRINHYNFCNTLLANNIDVLFLSAFDYCHEHQIEDLIEGMLIFRIDDALLLPAHIQVDGTHLTDEGHSHVAHMLYPVVSGAKGRAK